MPNTKRARRRSAFPDGLAAALAGVLVALAACGPAGTGRPHHPEWVIRSRLAFYSQDLQAASEPLPLSSFRLLFPYVSGDLYGPPTTGDFLRPTINADYTFEIDLNRTHEDLLRSLQPTEFSVEYLKIDPANTRIARLAPLALQLDGIEQIATADWIDPRSNERLMLVFADRPARITGALTRNGRTIRYNVRVSAPGYVWIGHRATDDDEQTYTEVEKPEPVILALTPAQVSHGPGKSAGPRPSDEPRIIEEPRMSDGTATSNEPRVSDDSRVSDDTQVSNDRRRAVSRARTDTPVR